LQLADVMVDCKQKSHRKDTYMPKKEPMPEGRARGGVARANKLTDVQRKEIAQRGAAARWGKGEMNQAICASGDTPLRLAGVELDAYVLDDVAQTRVLSQAGYLQALGRNKRAAKRGDEVPPMLQGAAFEPFLTPELLKAVQPVEFRTPSGLVANGYRAETLPLVCEVYLKARDAGTLAPNQKRIAVQADVLMRGLATLGIIALVDEVTGFQHFREQNALAKILERFVTEELRPWVSTFPRDYYKGLYKLRGVEYPDTPQMPSYIGHLTNDIVYKRLAPGVLDELKRLTPRTKSGRPKHKLHQRLTANAGYPKLMAHLGSVITIMKLSTDYADFKIKLDKLHPQYGTTMQLPFDDPGFGL